MMNINEYILLKTLIGDFIIFENRLVIRIDIRSSWRSNYNANLIFISIKLIIIRSRIVCIIIGLLDCISRDLCSLSVSSNWIVSSLSNTINYLRIIYFIASLTFPCLNRWLSLRLSVLTSTIFLWYLVYILTPQEVVHDLMTIFVSLSVLRFYESTHFIRLISWTNEV